MKSKIITILVVVAILGSVVALNQFEPQRLAQAEYDAINASEGTEEDIHAPAQEVIKATKLQVDSFIENDETSEELVSAVEDAGNQDYRVTFDCSNGEIVLEVTAELSPHGAIQLRKAIEDGVYDGARFFRVIPGFMAQFGISGNPKKAAKWEKMTIKDDPVKASNTRGTMSFATAGPDTRTTQLFINYGDNSRLDNMGFSPFAKVIKGMDVVDSLFGDYGPSSNKQDEIKQMGNAYLDSKYPKLDFIKKATISEIPVDEDESKSGDA